VSSAVEEPVRPGPPDMGAPPPPAFLDAVAPYAAELREELIPAGAEVFEAHAHLGLDEDGRSLDVPTLLALLDQAGAHRACVFPLHDPDRHPAYRVPNDRVLAWAAETDGRLVPFARLDPSEEPVAEGERCLAAGARGLKLHPRAQAFGFDVDGIDGIFALADEAQVPLLIHMGRGMPPVAEGLVQVCERHPGARLILAHGGIADQAVLTTRLADHPAVHYDTSTFAPADMLELFARVPAERILFASDPPYGRPFGGLYQALRVARHAGCDPEQLRAVAGASTARLVAGEAPTPARPPVGPRVQSIPGGLARIVGYSSMAFGAMFSGGPDRAAEVTELALSVCRDPEPGELGPTYERLGSSLGTAAALLRDPAVAWWGLGLLQLSTCVAATGGVRAA
jgi:uncharacterized protein